ncbi:MAG TPA: hypothetical protein VGQ09_23275 [Chitinophagaceae bacterium]|jgi:hypothetical protein|nr:hypothetical protein [Chitinophagaceae bacterium]
MIPAVDIKNITTEKHELTILKTLAYFDIFDYPLNEKEIKNFLTVEINDSAFRLAIQRLISGGVIYKLGEFYSLKNNRQMVEKRLQGNLRAQKLVPKAIKIGSFLYKFPYVRAIGISGSLSKNYADEKADIDFFVITKANRLWITRTILHLFKKLTFLFGKQHFYCMNYFIDEQALMIEEKNIYTATEIVTLLPVSGSEVMNLFFATNNWVKEWFPFHVPVRHLNIPDKSSMFKKVAEWLFDARIGGWVDDLLFKWTTQRWRNKEKRGQKNAKGRVMNLVTCKHFSKSNPEEFQERIIGLYETGVNRFKNQWPQYLD